MLPLIDMMMKAQGGQPFAALQKQYGMDGSQMEQALEALMPAFSTALKRNSGNADGMGAFIQALSSGRHAKYMDEPDQAFSSEGIAEGNGILGHLFGSKDVSRAVAAQAAQATGLSQTILKQMLPVIASMVMGGLFKQSTDRAGAGGGGPLGQIMETMLGGAMSSGGRGGNPLGDLLGQMMGGGRSGGGGGAMGDNPLGQIFENMLGGGQGSDQSGARTEEPDTPSGGLEGLFGDMFETGRQVQDQYARGMESIFDDYLDGMKRR